MIDLRRAEPDRPRLLAVALGTLAVTFGLMVLLVLTGWSQEFDDTVATRARQFSTGRDAWLWILDACHLAFRTGPIVLVMAVLVGWSWYRRERAVAAWLVVATGVTLVGNRGLKQLFARERPAWDAPLLDVGGHSFPSGHAAAAGLLATVLILLTIVLTGRGAKRRILISLWVTIGLFVAASRVFIGVHFVTDVVAGLAFGALVALATWLGMVTGRSPLPNELTTTTGTGRKRAAVIVNPTKVGDIDEFKTKVVGVAASHGWGEPLWWETTIDDPGHGQARAAIEAGVDLVVAAGGDGTVRAICDEAVDSPVAIGVLPHGTGNLLARNLGIPVNTRDALDVVFGGQDRAIDLAELDVVGANDADEPVTTSTAFLVMAGLGMDAMIMAGVNDELKKKVGYLAYFVSGMRAITFPRTKVWITIDDEEPAVFKARTVVVGNVGYLQGGIPLLPEAEIDDGELDVVVVAPKYFLGWLAIVFRVVLRRRHDDERLTRLRGQRVHIRAEKSLPIQLDGDHAGEGTEITATVRPGVILVRVPLKPSRAD